MHYPRALQLLVTITDWRRRVAVAGIGLFVMLVLSLHVLQPEVNALTVPVSDYVLGRWGWLMTVAFFSLAVGSWAAYRAVRTSLAFARWRWGTCGLQAWIGGTAIAGIFPTDAYTAAFTWHGVIHGAAATIALFGLIGVEIGLAWRPVGRFLQWLSAGLGGVAVAAFVLGFLTDSFSWSERAVIAVHCLWLMVLALSAERLPTSPVKVQLTQGSVARR